ncbi:MAG: undecaprenyl-phosphate glucose phosphotransferase [Planctomycetota bacterium]
MKSLRDHSAVWLQVPFDLILSGLTLLAAYWLGAQGIPFELKFGVPDLGGYLRAIPFFLAVFLVTATFFHLYRPRRAGSFWSLLLDLLKVNLQTSLIILAISFYYRDFSYSRLIVTNFILLNPMVLFLHHVSWMAWERRRYRKGQGNRSCVVIGGGELARDFANRVGQHPWTGLSIIGFLDAGENIDGEGTIAVPPNRFLGNVEDLERVVETHGVQEVVVAVPFRLTGILAQVDRLLARTSVGLRWVPDLEALNTLSREVSDFEGVHVFNLRGVRTYGMMAFIKRAVDIVLSVALLFITSPLLLLVALRIAATSGRPVLFKQDRVGLDGRVFPMLKFRTMVRNAEARSGPVWAANDDDRCTRFGAVLRRFSIDELPQLWNVLRGDMSLVGPRPERPVFIEEFRKTVPLYMLRHRMKAGLTGWAQVNGWRGNTSLKKRIQYDLYYTKNWTLWFDLKILVLTLVRGWGGRRNAY